MNVPAHPIHLRATLCGFLLLGAFLGVTSGKLSAERIESLQVRGTQRNLSLETKAGEELDRRVVARDVQRLWRTGRFDDIRVEANGDERGAHVVFHVAERPRWTLREVKFDPHRERRELNLEKGSLLGADDAHKAARSLEQELKKEGFSQAHVEAKLTPATARQADLELRVERGPRVRVDGVELQGELGLQPDRLRTVLRATRARRLLPGIPGLWKGWIQRAPYTPERVESDLAALRSLYIAEGYFTAAVGLQETRVADGRAVVRLHADAGPRYQAVSTKVVTPQTTVSLEKSPSGLPSTELCKCLLAEQHKAEREGRLDFAVQLAWERFEESAVETPALLEPRDSPAPGSAAVELAPRQARVTASLEPGSQYRLGRIEFRGLHKLRDATLRRAMAIDEGDLFNPGDLRKSVARLNRLKMIEPLSEADLRADASPDHVVNLTIMVRESKRGRWSISGPMGPVSLFGPLQFAIDSQLPPWGRGLFDLSTYYATVGLLSYADPITSILSGSAINFWRPYVALSRPLVPGQQLTSGFVLSPSLGWKGSLIYSALLHGQFAARQALGPGDAGRPPLAATFGEQDQDGSTAALSGMFLCRPPQPRLQFLRTAGSLILGLAGGGL